MNFERASLDLEQPLGDIVVASGAERVALQLAYAGRELPEVMVAAPDGTLPALAIADAVAAAHAWELWRAFLEANVGQHRDEEAWALLLRELWGGRQGHPEPPPQGDAVSSSAWIVVEVARPLPQLDGRARRAVVTVGGATLGVLELPAPRRPLTVEALRRRIEHLGGFELCRLVVREAVIGRPARSPEGVRERLRVAADARAAAPQLDVPPPPGVVLAPGWQRHAARALQGDGFVLARRRGAVVGLSGSRVAALPRASSDDLLAAARAAGDLALRIGEPAADAPVVYAPDIVWSTEERGDQPRTARAAAFARRLAATVRRRVPPRATDGPDAQTEQLPILMYHRVAPRGGEALREWRVTPDRFEAQLHWLCEAGYRSATFEEWGQAAQRRVPLPGRRVLLTFDDGHEDFADNAYPLLRQYGFEATVFLVSDVVGGVNEWDRAYGETLPLMDWDTILALDGRGVSFGGHTASHPRLTTLSLAEVVGEVSRCRAALAARLGHPVTAFSYPHGDADPAVVQLVGACGFEYAVMAAGPRAAASHPLLALPRLNVPGTASEQGFASMLTSVV